MPRSKRSRLTSETPPQQQHIHSSIPSVVAGCSSVSMLTIKFMLNQLPIALGVDTGASVTLLSESAYSTLKLKFPDILLELQKSNITLSSVKGSTLHVTGTVTSPISLAPNSKIFNIQFHVTPQFALPCDGLLGLDSLIAPNISVHTKRPVIFSDESFHPAKDVNFPLLLSIASITPHDDQRLSIPASSGSSEEKSSSSELWAVSAVVIGDQYIGPLCATRLSFHLKKAPVGSHVIFIPETMCIHHLCLESTLSAVHADHISDALVTNKTGSSITLKDGVLLGTFEVFHLSSIKELLPLPVNTQFVDVMDLTNVLAHLWPHINILVYPEAKPALLHLLAQHRQAMPYQGNPLE